MLKWDQFQSLMHLLRPETEVLLDVVFLSGGLVLNPESRIDAATTWQKNPSQENADRIDSFNWIELNNVVLDDIPKDNLGDFLDLFVRNWKLELELRYPNRKFVVRIVDPSESGDWYGIAFEQALTAR